jgi:hypothetical protein
MKQVATIAITIELSDIFEEDEEEYNQGYIHDDLQQYVAQYGSVISLKVGVGTHRQDTVLPKPAKPAKAKAKSRAHSGA